MAQNQQEHNLKPLSKGKYYFINFLFFLYFLFCLGIGVYLLFFWNASLIIKFILLLLLEITIPDLSIFEPYSKYIREFEEKYVKSCDNHDDKNRKLQKKIPLLLKIYIFFYNFARSTIKKIRNKYSNYQNINLKNIWSIIKKWNIF